MKKSISFKILLVLGICCLSQAFGETKPAYTGEVEATGCKYTGDGSDYCVFDKYHVYNCVNNVLFTTCAFEEDN